MMANKQGISSGPQRHQRPLVRSGARDEARPSTSRTEQSPSLQTLKEEVVNLIQSFPEGIEVSRLTFMYRRVYGKMFGPLSSYGLEGLQELFEKLGDRVRVERIHNKNMIKSGNPVRRTLQHPIFQDVNMDDGPKNAIRVKRSDRNTEKAHNKLVIQFVELVKDHPTGIPLKRLSTFFNQKYRRNLTVSEFGFSTIASFIDSLSDELLVEKEKVFHKNHRAAPAVPTPANLPRVNNDLTSANPTCPVVSFGADFAQRDSEMTQEKLMEKVIEVKKKFPAASHSFPELKKGYFLLFGSALPVDLYMSLYDSHTAKQSAPSCLVVNNKPAGAKCLETAQKKIVEEVKKVQAMPVVVNEQVVRSKAGSPLLRFQSLTVPPMATPSNLSTSDFPVLGTTLCKAEEKKLKEGRGPVFNESYYSQVREVHGANMRAAEALLEDEDNFGRRRKAMTSKDVNDLVEDVMRALAGDGELVTTERVISRVCSFLQVSSLKDMKIDIRRHLPAVQELQRTIKEINMYIESVESVSSICTLYELGQALANLKNKKRFEELHLGPLCKIPLIHRMFRIDANTKDDDVHQIATVDILRSLRMFRRKSKTPRIDLADFLKHLADQYSCESPYELGIRIQSLGLPISTLNKASAAEFCHMDTAREAIQKEIQEEVDAKMFKIKKSLMDPAQGSVMISQFGNSELRKRYANMTAADAVMEVFINSESVFNKSMTKTIQTFLLCINRDRLARALFQLAICCGSLDAPQDLVAKEKTQKKAEAKKTTEERATQMLPTEGVNFLTSLVI